MCNCSQPVDAKVIGLAVENGKNVIELLVNGSRVAVDTNIIGFARLAKLGVRVLTVTREAR